MGYVGGIKGGRRVKYKDTMKEMNCTKCKICIGKSVHNLNNQVFWCINCAEETNNMWRDRR
jgi:hypothetical protein